MVRWLNYAAAIVALATTAVLGALSYMSSLRAAENETMKLEFESKYADKMEVAAMTSKINQIASDVAEIKGYLKSEENYSGDQRSQDTAHK